MAYIDDEMAYHAVGNPFDEPAISLHAYTSGYWPSTQHQNNFSTRTINSEAGLRESMILQSPASSFY